MTLYERIRDLRIKAGMSQDELAHAMGYKDRSMITKIESGKVDISLKKILAFARVLNTTTSYLMGLDDSDNFKPELDYQPKNDDVRLLVRGFNQFTPDEIDQAKAMMRIMFAKHAKYFEEGKSDDT